MGFDGPEDMNRIDFERIASEEAFKAAVRTQETWRDNLDAADWRNTGEGIASIAIEPQTEGASEYKTGSDKVQILVAEKGRAPGSMPPHDDLADWVNEQANLPNRGEDGFENTVFNVRKAIAQHGIEGFQPGQRAFRAERERAVESIKERLNEEAS